MPIIRRKLDPNTVYPTNIRYNPDTDSVESNINGDWVDNPKADPRNQTLFPPRITSNPACDAAQSVTDALKGQIDGVVTAMDNGSTAFTIVGIILSFLSFGVFAVLVDIVLFIVDQMVAAGSTAINAALTEPVYETFTCIVYCQFGSDGVLKDGGLDEIISDTDSLIGGVGALVLNSMVSLAGEGGLNNLAAIGTSTGSCGDCAPCNPPCSTEWHNDNLGGGDPRGNILGMFDGWLRVESTNGGGLTHQIFLNSLDLDTCCQYINSRCLTDPNPVVAYYEIGCGQAQVVGNLVAEWTTNGCNNFFACQSVTNGNIPFVMEFLFEDCGA
jgi:hypothetical protein